MKRQLLALLVATVVLAVGASVAHAAAPRIVVVRPEEADQVGSFYPARRSRAAAIDLPWAGRWPRLVSAKALAILKRYGVPVRVSAAPDPWTKLRRPLRISRIAPGSPCPVTPVGSTSLGRAQGPGPVYPINGFPTLPFNYPPQPDQLWYGSRWSGQKVLWMGRPSYRGLVLIRGRQLDGSRELRFGDGLNPARELRLRSFGPVAPSGWRSWPSFTRLRAAGCYAWQVDGKTFSRVIVFRAVRVALS